MHTLITRAIEEDMPVIYDLFEQAIRFQKANQYIGWNDYDKEFIRSDIKKGFLHKLVTRDEIACIFSICLCDELIWRQREKGNAVYLHRIVLNRKFAGEKLFGHVLDWVVQFANENKLLFIRMDTWADNKKIIAYYMGYGFTFIENYTTPATGALPIQHRNLRVALLEKTV